MEKRPIVIIYGLNRDHYVAELVKAATSEDPMYRCVAAAASDTPRKVLKELCMDPNPMVRKCAGNNSATPPKYVAKAMEKGNDENCQGSIPVIIKFERKKAYIATLF